RGIPAIEGFADTVEKRGIPVLKKLYDKGKPLVEQVIPAIGSGLETAADALQTAAPYAERMVAAFNNAPDWVKKDVALSGLALYAGAKTGVLGKSAALAGVSKSSPLPVYVTNAGFGRGPNGEPVVTPSGDDRRPKGKIRRAGDTVGGGLGLIFGP